MSKHIGSKHTEFNFKKIELFSIFDLRAVYIFKVMNNQTVPQAFPNNVK